MCLRFSSLNSHSHNAIRTIILQSTFDMSLTEMFGPPREQHVKVPCLRYPYSIATSQLVQGCAH